MASSAPVPAEQSFLRPSFAKVAASAITPRTSNDTAPKARPPVATPRNLALPQNKRTAPVNDESLRIVAENNVGVQPDDKAGSTAARTGDWTDTAIQSAAPASDLKVEGSDRPRSIALLKVSAAEDSGTQLSSDDGSGKPPSIDGKSVASAKTFALDEKESLRPDDSASLRAVEEEDVTSPPDSVAESRQGSENGAARAFRNQLQEIGIMQSQRGIPTIRRNLNGPQALYDPDQPSNGADPSTQPAENGMPPTNSGLNPPVPDPKLLLALGHPTDRLWVLKIEKDFTDFMNTPGEMHHTSPSCNAYYRMLVHRLAEYFLLGHVVDQTQSAVVVTRIPCSRIPPPLPQTIVHSNGSSTPPVDFPTRKILRRDDGKSGTNTTSNSQNPSKATSEVGGSEGSNEGKGKAPLTREEREQRYNERRARIFGTADGESGETPEATGSGEDKDISRGLSNSKKKSKKPRNNDDDGFQSRSSYNAYYPHQQYSRPGYSGEGVVYSDAFSSHAPAATYSNVYTGPTAPLPYASPYPSNMTTDPAAQYGQYVPATGFSAARGPSQTSYDLSSDFQRGMSSFQNAGMPSQTTPRMGNIPMASYPNPYQPQQPQQMSMNTTWPQMPQQTQFQQAQGSFVQPGPGNPPFGGAQPTYPFGQFPPHFPNGNPNMNHPMPGSYNRPMFNPNSQAFVPGGHGTHYQMQQVHQGMAGQSQGPGRNTVSGSYNGVVNNYLPSAASTPSYGSPQSNHNSTPMRRNGSQPGGAPGIAKYGVPSNLPPRPPAPGGN